MTNTRHSERTSLRCLIGWQWLVKGGALEKNLFVQIVFCTNAASLRPESPLSITDGSGRARKLWRRDSSLRWASQLRCIRRHAVGTNRTVISTSMMRFLLSRSLCLLQRAAFDVLKILLSIPDLCVFWLFPNKPPIIRRFSPALCKHLIYTWSLASLHPILFFSQTQKRRPPKGETELGKQNVI